MNIEIMSFKEWAEKHYQYNLSSDLAILKKAERTTFDDSVRNDVSFIRSRILNSNRPSKDKLKVKQYAYCLYYLHNFLPEYPKNFDNLLALVNFGKPIFVQDLRALQK